MDDSDSTESDEDDEDEDDDEDDDDDDEDEANPDSEGFAKPPLYEPLDVQPELVICYMWKEFTINLDILQV